MSRLEKWSFTVASLTVGLSGIAYWYLAYGLVNDDPFSVINHPLQPVALDIHVLAAPVMLFLAGILFRSHVVGKLSSGCRPRRTSGLWLIAVFVLMGGSGYLLQVVVSDWLRNAVFYVHLITGLVFLPLYLGHFLRGARDRSRRSERQVSERTEREAA